MERQTIVSYQTPSGQTVKIIKHSFLSIRRWPLKRVAFVAGLHGNELEGIYLCHLLTRHLRELQASQPEAFKGEVHIYPAINPQAIATGNRLWPFFLVDMNRLFGGGNGKSLPAQIAGALLDDLKSSANIVVDFHASNLHLNEVPQIRIIDGFHKKLIPLAVHCNADLVWVHPPSPIFESTLGYNLNRAKVRTLIVEGGICLRLNHDFANRLFNGMLNLLYQTGILVPAEPPPPVEHPLMVQPSQVALLQSAHAGLFVGHTKLRQHVRKGDTLGEVIDPADGGLLQKVTAPETGFLFTLREHPLVYPGSPLARIAIKETDLS